MIMKEQMIDLLLEACPSYQESWNEYIKDEDIDEERLYYLDLSDFVRHLIRLYRSGKHDEFPAIFHVIEQFHTEGEHYVREAATIGILESLLTDEYLSGEEFIIYFGKSTLISWELLLKFWRGEISWIPDS